MITSGLPQIEQLIVHHRKSNHPLMYHGHFHIHRTKRGSSLGSFRRYMIYISFNRLRNLSGITIPPTIKAFFHHISFHIHSLCLLVTIETSHIGACGCFPYQSFVMIHWIRYEDSIGRLLLRINPLYSGIGQ